ncbi:MAG TPA: carboxymuconolactone decarboxylase family protein [Gemmatimonadales bacterium]|jgi:4-carboxymuconolactone decarboxylase
MDALDAPTAALLAVAAALNEAAIDQLAGLMAEARTAGAPPAWIEELVLNAVLLVGFPKALVAAAAMRRVLPDVVDLGDAADYSAWPAWRERGEATCRRIYGSSYENLVANVRSLHPALLEWVLVDGYGRTISRPGLDLMRRELCTIATLVGQGVPVQLHSHLRGAQRQGASPDQVTAAIEIAACHASMPGGLADAARSQWQQMRDRAK